MMAERSAVAFVLIVLALSLFIFIFEMFVPLSKNMDFKDVCRTYLVKMEQNSGLSLTNAEELKNRLTALGFSDIEVTAPLSEKSGQPIVLKVSALYRMNAISGILKRSVKEYRMEYEREVISRKVVN